MAYTRTGWERDAEFKSLLQQYLKLALVTPSKDLEQEFWNVRGPQNESVHCKPSRSLCDPSLDIDTPYTTLPSNIYMKDDAYFERMRNILDHHHELSMAKIKGFCTIGEQSPASALCFLWKDRSFTPSKLVSPSFVSNLASKLECVYIVYSHTQGMPSSQAQATLVLVPQTLSTWFWEECAALQQEVYNQESAMLEQKILDLQQGARNVVQSVDGSACFQKVLQKHAHSVKKLVFALPQGERSNSTFREMLDAYDMDPSIFKHTLKQFPSLERHDTSKLEEPKATATVAMLATGATCISILLGCTLWYLKRKS